MDEGGKLCESVHGLSRPAAVLAKGASEAPECQVSQTLARPLLPRMTYPPESRSGLRSKVVLPSNRLKYRQEARVWQANRIASPQRSSASVGMLQNCNVAQFNCEYLFSQGAERCAEGENAL